MSMKFNKKQAKRLRGELAQHKKDIEELKEFQKAVSFFAIWSLIVIGFWGTVATVFIDPIRGRTWEVGWLQVIGLIVFPAVFITGGVLLRFLRK